MWRSGGIGGSGLGWRLARWRRGDMTGHRGRRCIPIRRLLRQRYARRCARTGAARRRPLRDPHRPLDITDRRYVTQRTAQEPENPYSAAHRLERAEPFRPRGGHQDDTPV